MLPLIPIHNIPIIFLKKILLKLYCKYKHKLYKNIIISFSHRKISVSVCIIVIIDTNLSISIGLK